ncbi:MliC family protein [Niabella yanshanensis]|uniref:MliC family protein n=1 Tax=Niabella yanshanensis TaxID=577386 RepID=A0ABZ0W5V0_9BACT|nr:MliC family protein [Niabella yanshanensis]WQD37919.1 MliC family protein [Niabella yanshanensis]
MSPIWIQRVRALQPVQKTRYLSDENGKKLAVVYGFKSTTPNGIAIIEVEGEKSITLEQVETAPGARYEFYHGVTLKMVDKAVQLNDNGEIATYKEVLQYATGHRKTGKKYFFYFRNSSYLVLSQ